MSQKKESQQSRDKSDKWRDIAEKAVEKAENAPESIIDDEHLLPENPIPFSHETSDNKLRDQINLLEKQVEFYKDQTARTQAEFANARNRMEQEVVKARKFGVERLVSELVPVVDSLLHGLNGVNSDDPQVKLMRQGIELTLDMLNNLLEKNGIISINPKLGDIFDPGQHEAMSMRSEPDVQANTILQVLRKGYALHGRVIRAAMVIVSA